MIFRIRCLSCSFNLTMTLQPHDAAKVLEKVIEKDIRPFTIKVLSTNFTWRLKKSQPKVNVATKEAENIIHRHEHRLAS